MSKLLDKMNGLFAKSDQTQERYQKALEEKEEALIALQAELQEKQFLLKDMHKMKLLGEVSESSFEAEKAKVDKLQAKYAEAHKELELIEEYKTEDVKTVIEQLDDARTKYAKEHYKEIETIRTELLEAKLTYIEAMAEAGRKYNEIINPERKLDALKIKMGIKKNSYISDAHSALSMVSIPYGGYENLMIDNSTVHNSLLYGKTPESLTRLIEKRKA